ncbi:MAG: phosphate ABC transporter permease subunit PstC [Deltaproteobacteria bacterium RIFCSPLOWO2_02_FULL_53_8]|nr:MAG: phosphate ABC transporter permease subunit PstC [Deltaproteobacteria bacterium RIFCSPLOWO2_02_FULL_53_8]
MALLNRHKADRLGDALFKGSAFFFAVFVLVIMCLIFIVLLREAMPAIRAFGFDFLYTAEWDPVRSVFGALPAIYGTIISSIIALVIAVPISLGIAMFLTEMAPRSLAGPIGMAIELLAAIPSIIYGMWGLFILAPLLADHVEPFMIEHLGFIPIFRGAPLGIGMLPAGFILAIMIIPFISSVVRDIFLMVPPILKESGYGVGATKWEVIYKVILPFARSGIIGAIVLGLGRALGETMAVTFLIGNSYEISSELLNPATSISALLANEFTEAITPLHISSLVALGLILFIITFIVLAAAKLMIKKVANSGTGTR